MPPWKGIIGGAHTPRTFADYVNSISLHDWRPQFCVLHNTGIPRFAPWIDSRGRRQPGWHDIPGPTRMKALESYYRDVQKWSGGPHLFVADDYIWTFTPLWLPGVHAPSWNNVSWGVETIGDYDSEPLNAGVYSNAIAALAILHRFGNLDPAKLRYHKEDPKTTHYGCPGKNMPGKPFVISSIRQAMGEPAHPDFSDVTGGNSSTAAA